MADLTLVCLFRAPSRLVHGTRLSCEFLRLWTQVSKMTIEVKVSTAHMKVPWYTMRQACQTTWNTGDCIVNESEEMMGRYDWCLNYVACCNVMEVFKKGPKDACGCGNWPMLPLNDMDSEPNVSVKLRSPTMPRPTLTVPRSARPRMVAFQGHYFRA